MWINWTSQRVEIIQAKHQKCPIKKWTSKTIQYNLFPIFNPLKIWKNLLLKWMGSNIYNLSNKTKRIKPTSVPEGVTSNQTGNEICVELLKDQFSLQYITQLRSVSNHQTATGRRMGWTSIFNTPQDEMGKPAHNHIKNTGLTSR